MPLELESKIAVDSHDPLREKLRAAQATPHGRVLETNRLFDNVEQAIFRAGCGLRVRTAAPLDSSGAPSRTEGRDGGQIRATFTFKGPQLEDPQDAPSRAEGRRGGPTGSTFKRREEIELAVESADGLTQLLAALGYTPWLIYEKRRESWSLGPCKIELDEVPRLGRFVEVEGPDDASIHATLAAIGLAAETTIAKSYPALIAAHLGESAPRPLTLCF